MLNLSEKCNSNFGLEIQVSENISLCVLGKLFTLYEYVSLINSVYIEKFTHDTSRKYIRARIWYYDMLKLVSFLFIAKEFIYANKKIPFYFT